MTLAAADYGPVFVSLTGGLIFTSFCGLLAWALTQAVTLGRIVSSLQAKIEAHESWLADLDRRQRELEMQR